MTPEGEIVAIDQRGLFMGNRGCIHRGDERAIARPWQVRRWITCALEHKGWVAPRWERGRWTALFFWDEAVALAAGHRPCALCRRPAYVAWLDAWEAAFGHRPRADPMDERMHADRRDGRAQRRHRAAWADLPAGAFVDLAGAGRADPDDPAGASVPGGPPSAPSDAGAPGPAGGSAPALVLDDRLVPWSPAGYGSPVARPSAGTATVLTPKATVAVLAHGFRPVLHPTAGGPT